MGFHVVDLENLKTAKRAVPGDFRQGVSSRSFLFYFRSNLWMIILGILFLLGVFIGTILLSKSDLSTIESLKIILGGYVEKRRVPSFSSIALSTFLSTFLLLALLFFCGFCTISRLIIVLVPLFKGLGYGFSIGMIYLEHGGEAMKYVALLILPTMFLSTALLLSACKTSLKLSIRLFRASVSSQSEEVRTKKYCVKYFIFTLMCIIIALLDGAITTSLSGYLIL